MRTLREFLENKEYDLPNRYNVTFDEFEENNQITEKSIDWFCKNICEKNALGAHFGSAFYNNEFVNTSMINEMLNNPIPIEKLISELNTKLTGGKKYNIHKSQIMPSVMDGIFNLDVPVSMFDIETIKDVCDKFMWICTQVYSESTSKNPNLETTKPKFISHNHKRYAIITVEPVKAENKTEYVKKNCKGLIYHICKQENANKILKSGLRTKGDKNSYRFINNRTFFVCGATDEELLDSITDVCCSKTKYIRHDGKLFDNIRILKIDVSNYNIDFYKDLGYDSDNGIVYSYAYFPSKIIEDVTEEIKKKFDL